MLDLKIEGGTVIDGTGVAGWRADVGVRDGRIVAVGDLSRESAGRQLRAAGKAVAPGFIDVHSHSDWRLGGNRRAESKIRQGVTTEVVGNCGFSPAPVVFDPVSVADRATYEDPHRYPIGVEHVLVNGRFVVRDGEHSGNLPGCVLTPA